MGKKEDTEQFAVKITTFEQEGQKLAVIEYENPDDSPISTSYCDVEPIIRKAFNEARTGVKRAINNAGLPVPKRRSK